jgi:hypothetical protein
MEERVMRKLFLIVAAVAFMGYFAAPALAADWGFYGSVRMLTYMEDTAKEAAGTVSDDSDFFHQLDTGSRIGAIVKAGDITGRFEYGTTASGGAITSRLLYGRWNFGAGSILVGQDYCPAQLNAHSSWKTTLSGYGRLYAGRVPQVKLYLGNFQLALLEPKTGSGTGLTGAAVEFDTTLPKIEANYTFKTGPFAATAVFGYNTYDEVINPTATTEKEIGVDSMVYGVGLQYLVGPLRVRANVWAGTNIEEYGTISNGGPVAAWYNGNDIEDTDTMAYCAAVNYKISDTMTFDVGYGVQTEEGKTTGNVDKEREVSAYYALLIIKLAENVYLSPEAGVRDYGDEKVAGSPDVKKGKDTRYGVEFKVNF